MKAIYFIAIPILLFQALVLNFNHIGAHWHLLTCLKVELMISSTWLHGFQLSFESLWSEINFMVTPLNSF